MTFLIPYLDPIKKRSLVSYLTDTVPVLHLSTIKHDLTKQTNKKKPLWSVATTGCCCFNRNMIYSKRLILKSRCVRELQNFWQHANIKPKHLKQQNLFSHPTLDLVNLELNYIREKPTRPSKFLSLSLSSYPSFVACNEITLSTLYF